VRILQVIETGGPGGAETVFAQLASGLAQRGHGVTVLVSDGNWLPAELERRGFTPVLMHRGGAFDFSLLRQLVLTIRTEHVDLVHAHLFDGAAYATLAAGLCGVPCVTTLHGQVDVYRKGLATRMKAILLRHGASAVVAVSGALRDDVQALLRVPANRFRVVYNGLEAFDSVGDTRSDTFEPRPSRASDQQFRLIAIGNIRVAKDYPTLMRAMAALKERGVNVHLDVLGQPDEGGLYEEILALVHELGITPHVTFHGFVSNPAPFLARADAFVLASSREGFSLATIEAMLAGVPVIATKSGGPQEIVEHEVTGLLIPTGDATALAEAVSRLTDDAALAGRLANAGKCSAMSRFSVKNMVDSYDELYRSLLMSS